jgi:hypothetical protein
MLPAQFEERFRQIMAVKIDEVAHSVQADSIRASRGEGIIGSLSLARTLGLDQRRRVWTIERRIAAAVDAIKQVVHVMQVPHSDDLAGKLKLLVDSFAPTGLGERSMESGSPRLDERLKARYREELRATRGMALNRAVLEIDLLVDGLRANASNMSSMPSNELGAQFKAILLLDHQKELLLALVKAEHAVSPEKRHKFLVSETHGGTSILHDGLPANFQANTSDIESLGDAQLLRLGGGSRGSIHFSVTPLGFKYSQWLREVSGEPVERVTSETRTYIVSDAFKSRYPLAYEKWAQAEADLWGEDSASQLTTIGHLCREALQEFTSVIVERVQPSNVDTNNTMTVARMRAALDHVAGQLGTTEKPFLDALLAYWGTLGDLVQRQEHGAQKEGKSLEWEDARRVVFQTAVVIFEIDHAVSRLK